MQIAVTGATGFLGRYIVAHLAAAGHRLRLWYRPQSDRSGFDAVPGDLEWTPGALNDAAASGRLVEGCDAVVHAALDRPGSGFRGAVGDVTAFVEANVVGSVRLMDAARAAGAERFVYISSCAVHERILDDRPLDEAHPLWSTTHYGAHKAAVEKFVQSYGLGHGYAICAVRPTGIYGAAHPIDGSKWFALVKRVVRGQPVECRRGGKEVHAADVARAVELLLTSPAEAIRGEAFNCTDRYVSEFEVAQLAQRFSGAAGAISGEMTHGKHQISTDKLRALGMQFGGQALMEETIGQLVAAVAG